jgi:hypothetical protein
MQILKTAVLTFAAAAASFLMTGCNNQPNHPNQINTFDGATYDSLTVAHAALLSLRVQVSTEYPSYTPTFNQAAASYKTALDTYTAFRVNGDSAAVSLAMANLAASIVALEDSFETQLHVDPKTLMKLRARAAKLRAAAGPQITISQILGDLELAATIAEAVPGTQPYSEVAAMIIQATQQALAAETAGSGRPIDLSTIQAVAEIQ